MAKREPTRDELECVYALIRSVRTAARDRNSNYCRTAEFCNLVNWFDKTYGLKLLFRICNELDEEDRNKELVRVVRDRLITTEY